MGSNCPVWSRHRCTEAASAVLERLRNAQHITTTSTKEQAKYEHNLKHSTNKLSEAYFPWSIQKQAVFQ